MFPGAKAMPRLDGPPPPLLDVHALRHIVPSSAGSPRSRAASPSQNTRHQKRAAEQIADWLRDSERLKELQRRAEDAMRQADAVERARRDRFGPRDRVGERRQTASDFVERARLGRPPSSRATRSPAPRESSLGP